MNAVAEEILRRVRISDVYVALGGPKIRGMRRPAFWRGGDGLNVSLNDSRGLWHDFTTDEGGGILDLVVNVRGGNRADALKWCAELAGVSLEDAPMSRADRQARHRERRAIERDLAVAMIWRRMAALLAEALLEDLKARLWHGTLAEVGDIPEVEAFCRRLHTLQDAALVEEYRWWRKRHRRMTVALVKVGTRQERVERHGLMNFLLQDEPQAVA